ncbi:MAG: A/G-specific adenine glycosylase [Proteobacteria bacterium]|nr:A/G-specific adenine glycosylase [Pseudomonadota bacterium]
MEMSPVLADWFDAHGRDLPWRRTRDPYAVWVSEIMLQQTRVETVIPYYHAWLERFSDVAALARATDDEVLKVWEGLGYYRRALNLARAARLIVAAHGGRVPEDHAALLALPGVGAYTAGAVASFACNQPRPAVDGNVKRVLARLLLVNGSLSGPAAARHLAESARALIPLGRARSFNQGLMELGALICRNPPRCPDCPVRSFCEAARQGVQAEIPVREKRPAVTPLSVAAGVLVEDGKILVQKRPAMGLMPGLWEFPGGKLEPGETTGQALAREFSEELDLAISVGRKIAVIRHAYTRFSVTLHAFFCRLVPPGQDPRPTAADEIRWVRPGELSSLAFPAADVELIRLLAERGVEPD